MSDVNHNAAQDDAILLHLAVIEENEDVVKFLLKHAVPVNSRAVNKQLSLEFVTDTEHQKYVNSIQGKEELDDHDLEFNITKTTTALHLASRNKSKQIAELLLQHGAEINSEMEGGETPLIIAVIFMKQEIVELLVQCGADVNASTAWGKSALHYAAQTGQKSTLEYLLKHGGHVNAANLEGLTPMHIAAEAGHKELVAVLLKNGADINIKSKSGATALHFAVVMGHKEVVELLVGSGADINVLMKQGALDLSPFSWITENEEKRAWELVAQYTPKMSIVNWYNTMVTKLYRRNNKDRRSVFRSTESLQEKK
ncbi:putative ankyrin repeat protein RF_0381 [Nasonia vitripennis]|uniref:Uncharacterized protein n=1 Tax=Nasonia vitripennis TaxID=7425 RepID=A0A7M7HBD7_NASVI|nr:putative ankyrin repeat protein RF_0381 [Nasonia vitripennis]